MWGWLSGIGSKLSSLKESIVSLPASLIKGIKGIFVPDTEVIQGEFDKLLGGLKSKLGIDVYNFDNLFSSSQAPADIKGSYTAGGIWSYEGVFVDMSWVVKGVAEFRPYIRGFIVLLLAFFNIRQAFGMFGLSSGEIESAAKSKGGSK